MLNLAIFGCIVFEVKKSLISWAVTHLSTGTIKQLKP